MFYGILTIYAKQKPPLSSRTVTGNIFKNKLKNKAVNGNRKLISIANYKLIRTKSAILPPQGIELLTKNDIQS